MVSPDEYDDIERRCLPYWEAFFGTILDFINPSDKKILELASGTGFLTEMIAEKCPGSEITCVDIDSGMIEAAKRKSLLSKVRFIEGDMRDIPCGKSDVIVITQAVFAISDEDRKSLTGNIHDILAEGGRFIIGDMFAPKSGFEKDIYKKLWAEKMLINGFSHKEISDMLNPLDDYCRGNTVSSFVSELKEAGFGEFLVPYSCGYYGVVVAYR